MSNTIFVLFDDKGAVRNAAPTLEAATRYLIPGEFTTEQWNAIFRSDSPEERQKVYESMGWLVQQIEAKRTTYAKNTYP